jgi:hypothetical protein
VNSGLGSLHLTLVAEPPGVLVIQGDLPAQIYIDGVLVVEGVQNSGPQALSRGNHEVRVVLTSGKVIDKSVAIQPRERATYDYSSNAITRIPEKVSEK